VVLAPLAARGERLVGEEQQARRRVGRPDVGGEPVGVSRGEPLAAAHDDQAARGHEGQRLGGLHDRVHRRLGGVEDLAAGQALGGVGEEAASEGGECVVEELHVAAVEQGDGGRVVVLGLAEEGRVVQR